MVVVSRTDGEVSYIDATSIRVRSKIGIRPTRLKSYPLSKYQRRTKIRLNQRPLVAVGDTIVAGQVLADGSSTEVGNWL